MTVFAYLWSLEIYSRARAQGVEKEKLVISGKSRHISSYINFIVKATFDYYHHPIPNVNIFAYKSFFFSRLEQYEKTS